MRAPVAGAFRGASVPKYGALDPIVAVAESYDWSNTAVRTVPSARGLQTGPFRHSGADRAWP